MPDGGRFMTSDTIRTSSFQDHCQQILALEEFYGIPIICFLGEGMLYEVAQGALVVADLGWGIVWGQ